MAESWKDIGEQIIPGESCLSIINKQALENNEVKGNSKILDLMKRIPECEEATVY